MLWACRDPEVLVEGPAGTGKTRAILEYLWWIADTHPGARILLTRLERTRITRGVLVTFERDVIPPGHPCRRGAKRAGRHSYELPNGSEFIVQGAADIEGLKSQEYDIAYWNEITEVPTHEPFEMLHRALRSGPVPWRQLITDTNPKQPNHWILKRCERGLCRRIITRLSDNPRFHDGKDWTADGREFFGRMSSNTTGVNYKRLVLGEWCAAEGLVLPAFAENEALFRPPAPPQIRDANGNPTGKRDWSKLGKSGGIRWWFMSADWGTRKPGALQVWGVDGEGRRYRVAEIYRTGMPQAWWSKRATEFMVEFHRPERPVRVIVGDNAEPDRILGFNEALSDAGYPAIAIGCEKDTEYNLDVVRNGFDPRDPSIFLVQDSQRWGRDDALDALGKPCNTEEELLALVYPDHIDKPQRAKDESPDPLCEDHGYDAMLYGNGWAHRREAPIREVVKTYAPGSAGDVLGHDKKQRRRLVGKRDRWSR